MESPKYNLETHQRKSIRLKHYNYSQVGAYFITICTQNKKCLLGKIVNGKMILNNSGQIAQQHWLSIPQHFPNIQLDEFIIMPNHIHGIIILIDNDKCRGRVTLPNSDGNNKGDETTHKGEETSPLQLQQQIKNRTLGQVIAYFKYQSTKQINLLKNISGQPFWQRNYYEHIIRNESKLNKIREYIINNSLKWELDFENPERKKEYKDFTEYLKQSTILKT